MADNSVAANLRLRQLRHETGVKTLTAQTQLAYVAKHFG